MRTDPAPAEDAITDAGPAPRRKLSPAELHAARQAARECYAVIADLLKLEAGVARHHTHKLIGGIAWSRTRVVLAPEGVTRRQLYVLAHECGHVVLHSAPESWSKPGHVKEHEAETYAHRAFARYGLEVPEKSAKWARAYVGQWIMRDHGNAVPICPLAVAFARGERSPDEPLAAVDGKPGQDFSRQIERFVAKGTRTVERQLLEQRAREIASGPPNACGTCLYFERYEGNLHLSDCSAYAMKAQTARPLSQCCNNGDGWRPSEKALKKFQKADRGFFARLGDAIIDRLSGRYRLPIEPADAPRSGKVVTIEEQAKRTGRSSE